jgi:hypothetical protein
VYVAELVYVLLGMPEGRRGWLSAILIKYGDFVPLLSVMAYKVDADMRVSTTQLITFAYMVAQQNTTTILQAASLCIN